MKQPSLRVVMRKILSITNGIAEEDLTHAERRVKEIASDILKQKYDAPKADRRTE